MCPETTGFEIDFLPVGDSTRSGDAITLRFGNLKGQRNEQTVVVIDGGFNDTAHLITDTIRKSYRTDTIDLIVLTHPDLDHSAGLDNVINEDGITVKKILMHKSSDYSRAIKGLHDENSGTAGFNKQAVRSLRDVNNIIKAAKDNNVPIEEPFEGLRLFDDAIHILGPSQQYYKELVPRFKISPIRKSLADAFRGVSDAVRFRSLNDNGKTSPQNSSGVILLLTVGEHKILFTSDAGIESLTKAADYAEQQGIDIDDLFLLQIPHHGSKGNIGPTLLSRIKAKNYQISSSAKENGHHPSKLVVAALKKLDCNVNYTKGQSHVYPINAPPREN